MDVGLRRNLLFRQVAELARSATTEDTRGFRV